MRYPKPDEEAERQAYLDRLKARGYPPLSERQKMILQSVFQGRPQSPSDHDQHR
jgi:hypothetical protein